MARFAPREKSVTTNVKLCMESRFAQRRISIGASLTGWLTMILESLRQLFKYKKYILWKAISYFFPKNDPHILTILSG